MARLQRLCVVFSLAGYLLATTAVHALHNHSALTHPAAGHSTSGNSCLDELSSAVGVVHTDHDDDGSNGADGCHESARHDRHSAPTNCEDSCFACRFLAAKAIVPAIVVPVEPFETVCHVEAPRPEFVPSGPVECSLCRGPPRAC